MKPLLLKDLPALVGKTIKFSYEGYYANHPAKDIVETILEINLNNRNPITSSKTVDLEYSHLQYAFVENYSLVAGDEPDCWKQEKIKENNNCLSIGDSFREVFYEIVE